jgi:predicted ester cyclase
MADRTREIIEAHWRSANGRDWDTFAALLDPDLVYEVPQTRERARGAAGYRDVFCTWPGDWRADIQELVCEPTAAVCRVDFVVDGTTMTGISFFRLSAAGLITRVTDYWPEPYEPPPRASRFMERY